MATIDDLINQIPNGGLRSRIAEQVKVLTDRKEFGLVFQDHTPEAIEVPGLPPRKNDVVRLRSDFGKVNYSVQRCSKGQLKIVPIDATGAITGTPLETRAENVNVVKDFGEPIYAGLKPLSRIESGNDKPSHIIIQGENYYALETLMYTHEGKVDVIYIDPPYNTGSADWIYNDRYVDGQDAYRHSKWLAFMKRRLEHARRLLKPTGALAISIGEDEVHRLSLLVQQIFVSHNLHTVTVQTSGGKSSGGMKYLHEYLLFVVPNNFEAGRVSFAGGNVRTPWEGLTLSTFSKADRPNQVFPVFVERATGVLIGVGKSLKNLLDEGSFNGDLNSFEYTTDETPRGCVAIWPVSAKDEDCVWRLTSSTFLENWVSGYVKISKNPRKASHNPFSIQYLPSGVIEKIRAGALAVLGTEKGVPTLRLGENQTEGSGVPTLWAESPHFTSKGTDHLRDVLNSRDFPYPKPVELMIDVLSALGGNSSDGVILDFFAGTGTTAEAVMRLNAQDGGRRQSIIITNNELAAATVKKLTKSGHLPGDMEWESEGIFQKVTRPRVETVVTGIRRDGSTFSNGLEENVEFLELTYEDPDRIELGLGFDAIAALLWLKSGASGDIIGNEPVGGWAINSDGSYGVLFDVKYATRFTEAARASAATLRHAFIITNQESAFQQVVAELPPQSRVFSSTRLYSDYVRTFEINGKD